MARKSKAGDKAYNARRRYARQAERYAKRAEQLQGTESTRLRTLATRALENAYRTYEDPTKAKGSKLIQDLTKKLNPRTPVRKPSAELRKNVIEESESRALESSLEDEDERREIEAEEILSSSIGSRIYGALVDIWKDSPYSDRNDAIMDWFGVDSMADVIEEIENAGIDIYAEPESDERYDEVRTAISEKFL